MTGSSLPGGSEFGEIAAVFLERFVCGFGILGGDALVAADFLQRLIRRSRVIPNSLRIRPVNPCCRRHREQQVLDGDVFVFEAFGLVFGIGEQRVQAAGDVDLVGCAGRGQILWAAFRVPLRGGGGGFRDFDSCFQQDREGDAVFLFEEGGEEVLDVNLLIV